MRKISKKQKEHLRRIGFQKGKIDPRMGPGRRFLKGHKINVGKNRIFSEEHRNNMSIAQKKSFEIGRIAWNKGKVGLFVGPKGEKCYNWKGNNVGLGGLHVWIRNNKSKPLLCECCKSVPPRDVANISGLYKRDINDFEWLCRKCHITKDGRYTLLSAKNRIYNRYRALWKLFDCQLNK